MCWCFCAWTENVGVPLVFVCVNSLGLRCRRGMQSVVLMRNNKPEMNLFPKVSLLNNVHLQSMMIKCLWRPWIWRHGHVWLWVDVSLVTWSPQCVQVFDCRDIDAVISAHPVMHALLACTSYLWFNFRLVPFKDDLSLPMSRFLHPDIATGQLTRLLSHLHLSSSVPAFVIYCQEAQSDLLVNVCLLETFSTSSIFSSPQAGLHSVICIVSHWGIFFRHVSKCCTHKPHSVY